MLDVKRDFIRLFFFFSVTFTFWPQDPKHIFTVQVMHSLQVKRFTATVYYFWTTDSHAANDPRKGALQSTL